MTPAEIEAEAARLFAVWAAPHGSPSRFAILSEEARSAWLAVAEASLRAREDMRAAAQAVVDNLAASPRHDEPPELVELRRVLGGAGPWKESA